MKCDHPAFSSEFASLPCMNDATWEGRCVQHGGKVPTVQELMTLLGKLTGWDDQDLSVSVGYKRARVYDAHDDSHLNNRKWGFTARTRICGQDRDVSAQGGTLEEALWALCNEVVSQAAAIQNRAVHQATEAANALGAFVRARHVP
jgi:hypothetical protein